MTAWLARSATAADYPHFARLFPELAAGDPLPDAARWEQQMMPSTLFLDPAPGEDAASVAGNAQPPVAYGLLQPLSGVVYVMHVVVAPDHRGKGVGSALMAAIAERVRAAGCARWCLNVKSSNVPAIRLYERWGLRRAYDSTAMSLAWARVPALPREDAPIRARPLDPSEDAALELAFGLPPGRLTALRANPERLALRLVDDAHPGEARVGLVCFVPSFPGAIPFRVARPGLARHLLEALRPLARPGDTSLRLFIEDDAPLTAALRAAGAETSFELWQMTGDVPAPGRCSSE